MVKKKDATPLKWHTQQNKILFLKYAFLAGSPEVPYQQKVKILNNRYINVNEAKFKNHGLSTLLSFATCSINGLLK